MPAKWTLLLFIAALCPAQDARKLFLTSCAPCHGANGEGAQTQAEGVKPPDLTRGIFKSDDIARVIAKGVPESGMPSFEQLGAANIQALVAFVRSLSQTQRVSVGDAAAGEAIFWGKADCGRCHAVASRGTSIGPDLARGGGRRVTPDRIKKAIVAPGDEITRGYEVVTVVTLDHKTISGLQRFFDNFSARLIDESGNERTYLRDEVLSMKREMRSWMPGDYGQKLSTKELDDLVAYIFKIRSEAREQ